MRASGALVLAAATALVAAGCSGSASHPTASRASKHAPDKATSSSAPPPTPTPTPSRLTPGARLGGVGGQVVAVGDQVWAQLDTTLERIDPRTGAVVRSVDVGDTAQAGTTVVGTDVWAATNSGTVVVDTRSAKVVRRFANVVVPDAAVGWTVDANQTISRIDLKTGKVTGRASLGSSGSNDWSPILAAGAGAAWVGLGSRHEVVRVDAASMRRTVITGFADVDSLLVVGIGYGHVWAQQNAAGAGELYVIDPTTRRITSKARLGDPNAPGSHGGTNLVFYKDAVWTGDSSPTVTQVSAAGKVERVLSLPVVPQYVGVAAGSVWIGGDSESASPGLLRIRLK